MNIVNVSSFGEVDEWSYPILLFIYMFICLLKKKKNKEKGKDSERGFKEGEEKRKTN